MYNTRKRNISKNGVPDTNNNPKAQSTKTKRKKACLTKKVNNELDAVKPFVNKLPSPPETRKKVTTRSDDVKLVVNSSKMVQVRESNKNIQLKNKDATSPRKKRNSRSKGKKSVLNSSKVIQVSENNKNTLKNNTNKTSPHIKPNSRSKISKKLVLDSSKVIQVSECNKNTLDNNTDKTSHVKKSNSKSNAKKSFVNSSKMIQMAASIKNSPNNNTDRTSPRKKPASRINNGKKSLFNSSKTIQVSVNNKNTLENNVDKTPPRKKSNSRTNYSRKLVLNSSKIIQVLGNNNNKNKLEPNKRDKNFDIYEFTFDPNEEPQPQKKKRKKIAVKKQPKVTKPKAGVILKSTYNQNITKALSALKKAIKPLAVDKISTITEIGDGNQNREGKGTDANIVMVSKENLNDTNKSSTHRHNYPSIRIEDIAANIEPSIEHDELDYSPVNSPLNPVQPIEEQERSLCDKDPLNLQEDLSFFDDIPVANSSMNTSVRHPLASPWRVEFGNLPIKWHSNTYIKPNMTPAVESSFICSEDSNKKKHVYTNMLPEVDDPLPPISSTPNHKQPSIIAFMKEVAERKAQKKRGRFVSPIKATPVLENAHTDRSMALTNPVETDINNKQLISCNNTVEKLSSNDEELLNSENMCKDNKKNRKRKNNENANVKTAKSPRKQKNKDCTYFGFDESENQDQENMSPIKVKENHKVNYLRTRMRPVLQEINGPTRAIVPLAAKSKTVTGLEALNNVYLEMKSASDAPVFPEKKVAGNITQLEDPLMNDYSESIHLFEDIEVVHHLKPTRKSYGKAKKVTFSRTSTSDGETQDDKAHDDSSYEDDFGDLTFEEPNIKEKKKTKKKKPKALMSKKEEKEAEEWAAGFNSMCQEVEEFPLVVE